MSITYRKNIQSAVKIENKPILCFLPDSSSRKWIGMWWGGFLICGVGLILIAIPFIQAMRTFSNA